MEKEQIIKALKCCCGMLPCIECPYTEIEECAKQNTKDVIALIKELTEENAKLKQHNDSYAEIEQGYIVTGVKKVQANTVREFADRLKVICWRELISPSTIDRIAEEVLEE